MRERGADRNIGTLEREDAISFVPSRSSPDRVGQPNQRANLHPFILFRIDSISLAGRKPASPPRDRKSNEDRAVVIPGDINGGLCPAN